MILGNSGKAGAGKDTLANMIIDLDPTWSNRKFADKLKWICGFLTGHTDQYTERGKATHLPEWDMTIGELQQQLGMKVREVNADAWVNALLSEYTHNSRWIITDVRFPNEAEAIKRRGGLLVRIDGYRTETTRDRSHISETALDDWEAWDYRFDNSVLSPSELRTHAAHILTLAQRREGS